MNLVVQNTYDTDLATRSITGEKGVRLGYKAKRDLGSIASTVFFHRLHQRLRQ
jgi:hypothetical protein